MKTVLTSIITSIVTVIIVFFVIHAIWGEGECVFSDDHEEECTEYVKKDCDKRHHENTTHAHGMMMEKMEPLRAEFDTQLSDEEKATIAGIREKFGNDEHEGMCPKGYAKFKEQYKEEIATLVAIADNHKEYFDDMFARMHNDHKCKEAKETGEGEEKTPEEIEKCKKEYEEHINTFKVHFLLMDENEDDDDDD